MTLEQLIFYFFATVLVAAAVGVITSKNPVHAVLFLVFAFFNSAILWMLLEAEFLAITLVLVYVGAVMVLFLFVVMMLDINVAEVKKGFTRYAPLGLIVTLLMMAEIAFVVKAKNLGLEFLPPPTPNPVGYSNTKELGSVLYTDYVYPFEIAAMILLVAIVAAIVLTMRKRPGLKAQDIAKQVAVRAQDRIRIVKMDPEKKIR